MKSVDRAGFWEWASPSVPRIRVVSLSIKAKEAHEEAQALQNYKTDAAKPTTGTTLGDLLKQKMTPE